MDPLSRLPVECLEHILRCIISHGQGSFRTLAHLRLVNRYISQVAHPFMIEDLFKVHYNLHHSHNVRQSRERIRTLLTNSNAPVADLHPALAFELYIDNTPGTTTTTTASEPTQPQGNYLPHIRNINFGKDSFVRYSPYGHVKIGQQAYSAERMNYIHSSEFMGVCIVAGIAPACVQHRDPKLVMLALYPIVVYREAIWALAFPNLNQLVSLSMPMSDIRRYHDVVARLEKLEFIHVVVDFYAGCGRCRYDWRGAKDRPCRDEAMRDLVELVKEHRQRFPGRLKAVTSSDAPWMGSGRWCDSMEINSPEIQRMLPLYRPQSISPFNWERISPFIEVTDLGNVHEVWGLDPMVTNQQFLQRCRLLRNFATQTLAAECFDWAVQEKKDLEAACLGQVAVAGSSAPAAASGSSEQDPGAPYTMRLPPLPPPHQPGFGSRQLVPLAKVSLHNCDIRALPDIDAIANAFSNTLERLYIRFQWESPGHSQAILLGRGWINLPRLTSLDIQVYGRQLTLDPLLLSQCPKLTDIKAIDYAREYSCDEIVPYLRADLSRVGELELKGLSALGFHPDTLKTTKSLRVLVLLLRQSKCCFIPPVDELRRSYGLESKEERDEKKGKDGEGDDDSGDDDGGDDALSSPFVIRPRWTWDWRLPLLTTLRLNGEFAYLFEFRMLHGCPALGILTLHMRTLFGRHTRVITQADLYAPGAEKGLQERIVAPNLRRLYMNGHWSFEDPSVLTQFLSGGMFPKLKKLTARAWDGVTVGSFVEAIRARQTTASEAGEGASHIGTITTFLPRPSSEQEGEWGVFPHPYHPDSRSYDRGADVLSSRLFCSGREYLIRKESGPVVLGGEDGV